MIAEVRCAYAVSSGATRLLAPPSTRNCTSRSQASRYAAERLVKGVKIKPCQVGERPSSVGQVLAIGVQQPWPQGRTMPAPPSVDALPPRPSTIVVAPRQDRVGDD